MLPAAVVGAASHLLWDELTHPGRWGTDHVPALARTYGPLIGASWFQYVSGLLGTAAVLAVVALRFARQPPVRGTRAARRLPRATWLVPVVVGLLVGAVLGVRRTDEGLRAVAFAGVVGTIVVASAALLALVVAWHARSGPESGEK